MHDAESSEFRQRFVEFGPAVWTFISSLSASPRQDYQDDSENWEIGELTEESIHTGYLDLSSKNIDELPHCVLACSGIQSLNLSCNCLESLSGIENLLGLSVLDASFNKLHHLPSSISKLHFLTSLNVSYNQLKTVGQELCYLINLHSLSLNDNQLQSVPSALGSLTNLEELHLQYNHIRHLPTSLGELHALQVLELEGNPLTSNLILHIASASCAQENKLDIEKFRQLLYLQPGQPQVLDSESLPLRVDQYKIMSLLEPEPHQQNQGQKASGCTSMAHKPDILIIEGGDESSQRMTQLHIDDQEDDIQEYKESLTSPAGPHSAFMNIVGELPNLDTHPLSANEASTLEEVMAMPPAAAAVMYRTWDSVRTGVHELQGGRPLSRGGAALAGGGGGGEAARQLLTSSGRLLTAAGPSQRPRSSVAGRPSSVAGVRPGTGGSGCGYSSSLSDVLGHKNKNGPIPSSTSNSAVGAFEGMPPISFPLASGVRSMLKRLGSASRSSSTAAAGAAATDTSLKKAFVDDHPPVDSGSGCGALDNMDNMDLVRQLLSSRNPKLLATLDTALEEEGSEEEEEGSS